MATRSSSTIRFRVCQRCGGAAYLDAMDEPEWRCLMCARTVPGLGVPRVEAARAVLRAA